MLSQEIKQEIAEYLDGKRDLVCFRLLEKDLAYTTTFKLKRAVLLRSHFQAATEDLNPSSSIECTVCGFINPSSVIPDDVRIMSICTAPFCNSKFRPRPRPLQCVNYSNPCFRFEHEEKFVISASSVTYQRNVFELDMYKDLKCHFRQVEIDECGNAAHKPSRKFIFGGDYKPFARAKVQDSTSMHKISVRYLMDCKCGVDMEEDDATPMSCEANRCVFSPWSKFTRPVHPMTFAEVDEITTSKPGFLAR